MAPLQFRFLGVLEICYSNQLSPKPATRKSQSLLAYLVLHRDRPHSRERLTALFWGDRPEHKARRSLTTALWHIRRSLPDADLILSDSHTVQFDPQADMWLDLEAFESQVAHDDLTGLLSAVEMYRGEFLEGFYDDWVINVRYRLEAKFVEALARLMVIQENRGRYTQALGIGQRLLNQDPLREDAHRLVMRVNCRLGQRNHALEQYHICRKILREELGAEPAVSTTELYQGILEERYLVEQPKAAPETVPTLNSIAPAHARNPLDVIAASSLVGRESELNFLKNCWGSMETGLGGLVLISGEAGIGKTRLIEEFCDSLRWRGGRVLWGRCYELERFLPYQPLAEVVRSALPAITSSELEDLAPWVVSQVARLVPEIVEQYPSVELSYSLAPNQEQSNLFAGVLSFISNFSSSGAMIIVLEDLHWATESSLQMIHYLLRNLAGEPIMIIGSFRPEALSDRHHLWALQQELSLDKLLHPLHLSRLSAMAVDEILVEMSGLGKTVLPLSGKLYRETEGNPFFLMEIIKALFERGEIRLESSVWQGNLQEIVQGELQLPTSLKEAIQDRVRRLSRETQEALRLAAVLGLEFDFDLLEAVWNRGEENAMQALEELLRQRLIEEGTGLTTRDYVFTHHKIQEVVYSDISNHHRAYAHARIGAEMEESNKSSIDEMVNELAFHFEQGRRFNEDLTSKAIGYLLKAGDQARMVYAHQEAIEHYRRALPLLEEQKEYELAARTLMRLGLTYHTAFDFPRARQAYDEGFILLQREAEIQQHQPLPPAPHALRLNWDKPLTLDPTIAYDVSSGGVMEQLFSELVEFSPEMEVVPDLAKEWEVLEGGCKYIFHLRNEAYWSDGVPVTAGDFEFAWRRMLDPATEWFLASQLYDIKGAKAFHQGEISDPNQVGIHVLDDTRLVVELEKPACYFLHMLAYLSPLPRHSVEVHTEAWSEEGNIVTNGPFKLREWFRDKTILLVRNQGYHGRFRGNVQEVEFCLHENSSANLALYEADKLDVLDIRLFPPDELDIARQRHLGEYVSLPWLTTDYIGFNVRRKPFNDPRVRRAFVMALDREMFADINMRGTVFPATGGFIPPGMPGHSPGIALDYDPDQARQLLSVAGYPDGRAFPAVEALTRPGREAQTNYIQSQWHKDLGIKINWQTWETDVFLDKLVNEPPSIFIIKWMADYPDPDNFLRVCPARRYTGWYNEVYEYLVEEAKIVKARTERLHMYQDADKILIEAAAIGPLCYQRIHLLVKPWVKRYPTSAIDMLFLKDVIIEPH